jgi:hypothetical protein
MIDETEEPPPAEAQADDSAGERALPADGRGGADGQTGDAPDGSAGVPPVAEALAEASDPEEDLDVEVAYEVIRLLSSQLYSSPLKAVEELVVNSWDADATDCYVYVPSSEQLAATTLETAVAVLDNGHGMTVDELRSLWHVGMSPKREEEWKERAQRQQIGKFGIGKLASYVLARRVTYITRPAKAEPPRGVTIDFEDFRTATDDDGNVEPIRVHMLRVEHADSLLADERIEGLLRELGADPSWLGDGDGSWDHWTLVVLENIKSKARDIREGRLRWVLGTAMPAASDFKLHLNSDEVESAKLEREFPIDFRVSELPDERLEALGALTGEQWSRDGDRLVSPSFPTGVEGRIRVASESLYSVGAKSEDLGRSHGFFVRVLKRLVNEADPLFGARPLSFTTFYNLLAEVEADDLDSFITAPRDDLLQVEEKTKFRELLLELFREARGRYQGWEEQNEKRQREKKEEERSYVNPRLVERPVADAFLLERREEEPAAWQLVEPNRDPEALARLIQTLYTDEQPRRRYSYQYRAAGKQDSLVRFDPEASVFWVNENHDLVVANYDDPEARRLLEIFVTAEAMLEVYLREVNLDPRIIEHILTRRDQLLRSLSQDELYSLKAIAEGIRDAKESAKELEIAVVGALRALGFVAKHISGAGTPDGEANYVVYGPTQKSFTLETKSSGDVPELGHLDFAGLKQHYVDLEGGAGCLLVSPAYPGPTQGNESQVAKRAREQGVSCWTVEGLARVVEAAEARHITAEDIQGIVLSTFTPDDVDAAVERLLTQPGWNKHELYTAILETLAELEDRLSKSPRDISMLAGRIAFRPDFTGIESADILEAAQEMATASRGMLHVTDEDTLEVPGSLQELGRRLESFTGESGAPRRRGTFRDTGNGTS